MSALEILSAPSLAGSGIAYAYAVKAGPWIFLTGHEGFDFETGSIAAVAGPEGFPAYDKSQPRREAEFIFARMRETLQRLGSDLDHALRLDQFYPAPAAVVHYQRARHAAFGKYIPPSTSIIMERCLCASSSICASLIAVEKRDGYAIEGIQPGGVPSPTWSGFVPTIVCGDFIFVAGQMATNSGGDGLDPSVRTREDSRWSGSAIRLQTEFLIVKKLIPALESAGAALQDAVKAQVYIEGVENFPDFFDVWSSYFKDIPCALTIVPAKSFATVGGIIEINLIGLKPGGARRKSAIEAKLPRFAAYGPAVQAGEFLFPSGLMAVGEDAAIVARETSARFPGLALSGFAQASLIYDYVEALCAASGASLANVIRAQYFCSGPAEFPGIAAAWRARRGQQPHPFLCVQTPPPMPAPGAGVIADFWIYNPSENAGP